jgi:putative transposase
MKITRHITRPIHIYQDNTPYFITASTFEHQKLLNDTNKTYLQTLLHEVFTEFSWQLEHWVILDNHYHLLCQSKYGKDLRKIINKIHNLNAQKIKREQEINGKVWSNYWDYCPRNDKEYNTRLCYLLNNPYKHGYVEDLHDWKWSSFHQYFKQQGEIKLKQQFREFTEYRELELEAEPRLGSDNH